MPPALSTPNSRRAISIAKIPSSFSERRKAVVVQSGARDAYQLALALSERGMLTYLVTDLFWPLDQGWARAIDSFLPQKIRTLLLRRSERRLAWTEVKLCVIAGLSTLVLDKLPKVPLAMRRQTTRNADAKLGQAAGRLAKRSGVGLVAYSYYGYDAFMAYEAPGVLFQLHPHPVSMRRILSDELAAHPDCADSLQQEWELSLPEEDFQHLVLETKMASSFLVASSFTKRTLLEHGAIAENICVVPYGVDLTHFCPGPPLKTIQKEKLQLLFVGRINQRKGIKYLLEALKLTDKSQVELIVCGRAVDDLDLFEPFTGQVTVRPSVSEDELLAAYQSADLFVLPSVAEGFGQVLLESLACGLPILSTTNTAAPDLIDDGIQGFIIEPRRPDLIAQKIKWALEHREELLKMSMAARARAEEFTWERFRHDVADAVQHFLSSDLASKARRDHV